MEATRTSPIMEGLLWLLLMGALAPVWLDWGQHLVSLPGARYAALFLPLTALLAWRDRRVGSRNAAALWWVAAALVLSVLAVGSGLTRFARLCLPLAILGMARWRGWPRAEVALMSLWWVPIPSFLMKASGKLLAALPLESLPLEPMDAGLPLVALLSGLAYWAAIWSGQSLMNALRAALLSGLIALPLQAVVLVAALGSAAFIPAASLRAGLDLLPAVVTLATCVAAAIVLDLPVRHPDDAPRSPRGRAGTDTAY